MFGCINDFAFMIDLRNGERYSFSSEREISCFIEKVQSKLLTNDPNLLLDSEGNHISLASTVAKFLISDLSNNIAQLLIRKDGVWKSTLECVKTERIEPFAQARRCESEVIWDPIRSMSKQQLAYCDTLHFLDSRIMDPEDMLFTRIVYAVNVVPCLMTFITKESLASATFRKVPVGDLITNMRLSGPICLTVYENTAITIESTPSLGVRRSRRDFTGYDLIDF